MKRYRFNTKVGRSDGIGEFRNRGSDYYEYAGLFRTCSERGRLDIVGRMVDYSTTIYGGSSYVDTREMWKDTDVKWNVWQKDYWMREETVSFRLKEKVLKKVYDAMILEHGELLFATLYTPVYWDNGSREGSPKDLMAFADYLVHDRCGWNSIETFNFALRILDDGRRVLYGRNKWLRMFRSGRDIINYYRVARNKSFRKVYGF